MKHIRVYAAALAAGGLLFCSACNNDYTGRENSHPLFSKGMTLKSGQNYSKAREAFEGFLVICPKSAKAHRELAELYSDYLGDYVRAVYHYEKYIELGKLGDADRRDVRKLIDACKKKFYERYQQENGLAVSPEEEAQKKQEMTDMENGLIASRKMQELLTEKVRTLMADKKKLEAELKAAQTKAPAAKKNNAPSVRVPATHTAEAEAQPVSGEFKNYTVQPGESLSVIARKFYGKTSAWKTIRDANPGKINEKGVVRAGQVIRIPVAK